MQPFYDVEEVDHFGKPIPEIHNQNVIETDYRLFRYSKFALPWLLFMLACCVTLFCLTLWQGGFAALKGIKQGIPRDLEPYRESDFGDGGRARGVRNLRFAAATIAFVSTLLVLAVYYVNPRPKTQRLAYYLCAFLLLVAAALALIAFCLDVGKSDETERCKTEFRTRIRFCENRAAYGVAVVVLDAALAIFALVTCIMLALWTKDETFHNTQSLGEMSPYDNNEPRFPEEAGVMVAAPGTETVHKSLIFIGLTAVILSAILLLIFSIFIHEFRERVTGVEWDPINSQSQSGWPRENSRLRLAAASIGIILCLLSFVPLPLRIYVYFLAFLFLICAVLLFVAFGLDVKDLGDAKDLACPTGVSCVFHPYNATVFFDIFTGVCMVLYLLYEFLVKHKQSTVTTQRTPAGVAEEFAPDYEPLAKAAAAPAALPTERPLLGVEVVEVAGANGELNVTVMNVTPGSAADEALLQPGDIIAHWDEMPIHCKADFAQAVSGARIGSTVNLHVARPNRAGAMEFTHCKLDVRGVPV